MKNTITTVLMAATAAVSITAAPVVELETRELDFKLQWYRDAFCSSYVGEYDYNSGGIFHSGDTAENCKNIPLTDGASANIIGGDVGAFCSLFVGPNCSGQELVTIGEGTAGQFGNSACYSPLATLVQSFRCNRKGTPVKV
jgi:hypothetical protein